MMRHSNQRTARFALVALGALTLSATATQAKTSEVTTLAGTPAAPGARGRARTIVRGTSDGAFLVTAHGLARRAHFDIVVDAVRVGTLATNGHGGGTAHFRTRPRHGDQLLGFEPRGAEVDVRNGAGEDVLRGNVPGTTPDPTKIICCVADHGGDGAEECEDRTPDACTAAGGTVTQATSCLPNPCATTPPVEDEVACCEAGSAGGALLRRRGGDDGGGDAPELECELRTAAKCAARGGTAVSAASCDPNPCTPPPPPPPAAEVNCCLPGYYTAGSCAVLTADQCASQNGKVTTAPSCTPNPCAASGGHGHHGSDG